MIVIILYITVAFANHSSRRLLANQKPTTLRKNVAKLNETSLRYFRLILDPIRYTDSQFIGGIYLLIIEKLFRLNCSLSLFDLPQIILYCPFVHNVIYSLYYSDISELSITYVRNVCDQWVMHDSRYCKSSVKSKK